MALTAFAQQEEEGEDSDFSRYKVTEPGMTPEGESTPSLNEDTHSLAPALPTDDIEEGEDD
jgi:hypothetical protein